MGDDPPRDRGVAEAEIVTRAWGPWLVSALVLGLAPALPVLWINAWTLRWARDVWLLACVAVATAWLTVTEPMFAPVASAVSAVTP